MKLNPVLMDDKRFDEISELIRNSYKNSCILFIDEVDNPDLITLYENYKSELIKKRGEVDEKLLFHGTHAGLIDIISRDGFDPEKNIASVHGRGTYFAKSANYSKDYMKSSDKNEISYMFLSKVALGKYITYNDYISLRINDFDNYVDNIEHPNIFVCPNKDSAYPQYIIAFYKNAQFST